MKRFVSLVLITFLLGHCPSSSYETEEPDLRAFPAGRLLYGAAAEQVDYVEVDQVQDYPIVVNRPVLGKLETCMIVVISLSIQGAVFLLSQYVRSC